MISKHMLELAKAGAKELRRLGQDGEAQAVEALVAVAREEAVPTLDLLTTTEAGEVFGVTGQTIKNWVRSGQLKGFRVGGRIMLPREAVVEYGRRARASLDLEALSDEAAAALVAEGRRPHRRKTDRRPPEGTI